jgi:hypothetical protein
MALMNIDEEIPHEELEAAFKNLKKNGTAAYMKVYEDGGVKLIDNQGVITVFETYHDFLKHARRYTAGE